MNSISIEPGATKYFHQKLADLLSFDINRINQLLELTQYSITFTISCIIVGLLMNVIFPAYNDSIGTWQLFFEIVGELIILTIGVFYIRKINHLIPFMFYINDGCRFSWNQLTKPCSHRAGDGKSSYKPYNTTEYQGEVAFSLIFVGVQFRLIRKLALFAKRMGQLLVKEGEVKNEIESAVHTQAKPGDKRNVQQSWTAVHNTVVAVDKKLKRGQ